MVEKIKDIDVVAVNIADRMAKLSSGIVVPITNFYSDLRNEDGTYCETTIAERAKRAVAGRDGVGWFSIELDQFCSGGA